MSIQKILDDINIKIEGHRQAITELKKDRAALRRANERVAKYVQDGPVVPGDAGAGAVNPQVEEEAAD